MIVLKKIAAVVLTLVRLLGEIGREFGHWATRSARRFAAFVKADHRYVYLGATVLWVLTALLLRPYFGARPEEAEFCLLYSVPAAGLWAALGLGGLFVLFSLAAGVTKVRCKRGYRTHPFFKHPLVVRFSRYYSYYIGGLFTLVLLDATVLRLASIIYATTRLDKNPQGFFQSMVYMGYNGGGVLWYGIRTTVELALLGTVIGFVLACLMVFMRVQKIDKRDSDLVKFFKKIGLGFSKTYITVVRGTPMMVQASIIYYAGANLVQALTPNASVSQQLALWPVFAAGLVTISLNTTAYIAEVLRGSVEAIDRGQTEAARSLGMGPWKTMTQVVFPQAIRNSVPAIGNEFIINIKDSSVLNVIGVIELMFAAKTVCGTYYKYLPVFCLTALIYLCLTCLATALLNAVTTTLGAPKSKGIPSCN